MATETTTKTEKTAQQDEAAKEAKTGEESEEQTLAQDGQEGALGDDERDDLDEPDDAPVSTASGTRGGLGAGAAAIVGAALGLCSLTGTTASEMLRERKQIIGQMETQPSSPTGGGVSPSKQIEALYGGPWHAAALVNGIFAFAAVVIGGVLLALLVKSARTADSGDGTGGRTWVRPVAFAGLILGVLGLFVAGGMYFDVIAGPPQPPAPGS